MSIEHNIDNIVEGRADLLVFNPRSRWCDVPPENAIVLAGSFRPLHRAHRALLETAMRVDGGDLTPCFEISVRNVEKPDIDASEILKRLAQFDVPTDTVLITNAATFPEKASLLLNPKFVIGYDTAVRLFEDRFYERSNAASPTLEALEKLKAAGAHFYVGGRHDQQGGFKTVRDINVPDGYSGLLTEIPETLFSDPISSTQLRETASG